MTETLPTTQRVELIDKKEFAVAVPNKNTKIFLVHIATLLACTMQVHLFY